MGGEPRLREPAHPGADNIPSGEELTFDYVDGVEGGVLAEALNDPEIRENMERGLCGERQCLGSYDEEKPRWNAVSKWGNEIN